MTIEKLVIESSSSSPPRQRRRLSFNFWRNCFIGLIVISPLLSRAWFLSKVPYIDVPFDVEEYCRDKWGFTSRHANRLMVAGEVMGNLKSDQLVSNGSIALPENEAQARALAKLPPAQQVEAARVVAEKPGKHSTEDFKKAAAQVRGKTGPTEPASSSEEDKPRISSYTPDRPTQTAASSSNKQQDKSDLELLIGLVDEAQTQARKMIGYEVEAKTLGEMAKSLTRKLNGGSK